MTLLLEYRVYENFPAYSAMYPEDKQNFPIRQDPCILQKDEIPDGIYFIVKGEAYASNASGKFKYFTFPEKSFFGETHLLTGIKQSYTIMFDPSHGTHCYFISRENFFACCERFPDSYD